MLSTEAINMERGSAALNALLRRGATTRLYKAGLYLRLSREDSNKDSESMSIQSQKGLLLTYAAEHGYDVEEIYVEMITLSLIQLHFIGA